MALIRGKRSTDLPDPRVESIAVAGATGLEVGIAADQGAVCLAQGGEVANVQIQFFKIHNEPLAVAGLPPTMGPGQGSWSGGASSQLFLPEPDELALALQQPYRQRAADPIDGTIDGGTDVEISLLYDHGREPKESDA